MPASSSPGGRGRAGGPGTHERGSPGPPPPRAPPPAPPGKENGLSSSPPPRGPPGSPRRSPPRAAAAKHTGASAPRLSQRPLPNSDADPDWRPDYSAFRLPAPPRPVPQRWVPGSRAAHNAADNPGSPEQRNHAPGPTLRVASFNLLAQSLLRRDHHPHTPKAHLKLAYRLPLLLSSLLSLGAGVACLQEFDRWDAPHTARLEAEFAAWRMRKKRVKGSRVEREDGNNGNEGQGLLVCVSRGLLAQGWSAMAYEGIFLDECLPTVPVPADGPGPPAHNPLPLMLTRGTETGNVAQILLLHRPTSSRPLLIINTHLFWRPKSHLVRLRQLWALSRRAASFLASRGANDADVMLCGDLNLKPADPLYPLLFRAGPFAPGEAEALEARLWELHLADLDPGVPAPPRWSCTGLSQFFSADTDQPVTVSGRCFGSRPWRSLLPSHEACGLHGAWSTAAGYGAAQWRGLVDYVSLAVPWSHPRGTVFAAALEPPRASGRYLLKTESGVQAWGVAEGMPGMGWGSDHVAVGGEVVFADG